MSEKFEPSPELQELALLQWQLADDVGHTRALADDFELGISRRHYVRAVFAWIEAITWSIKQVALSRSQGVPFTEGERAILRDVRYELSDRGAVMERLQFLRPDQNLRFALSAYAQSMNVDYEVDCSCSAWASFKAAIRLRNRLTHPKRSEDLEVSDEEYEEIEIAYEWMRSQIQFILRESMRKLFAGKIPDEKIDDWLVAPRVDP